MAVRNAHEAINMQDFEEAVKSASLAACSARTA
jgi:hypothetical protein